MKIIVMGYHNIGYACLKRLLEMKADIAAVTTHRDNPRENIWFSSVRDLAFENYLPVYQPADVNDPRMLAAVKRIAPDVIFSFYFRQILGNELLGIPRIGAFNLHGSLLPSYRGRCPVNWVLINGEKETGVSLHRMEEKPDRGAIVAQRSVRIDFKDSALTLFKKMTEAAYKLMGEVYPLMLKGEIREIEQNHSRSSYFGGRKPEDGLIDWSKSSTEIYNLVRAVTYPYPGAFTRYGDRKLFIWWAEPDEEADTSGASPGQLLPSGTAIATGRGGVLKLKLIQWEGGPELEGKDISGGIDISPGSILGL